jgi:putative FmdB family regulatory protein
MPLYEYQCDACGHTFEVIQKFSDPPVETCPKCGGPVRKLLSSPAFQFKGTGWYVTDYAKKGSPDGAKGGKEGAKEGAESKTETKTETKSETSKKEGAKAS